MKWYDISRPLHAATASWPGDEPFRLERTMALAVGESVNLSKISLSPHNGTHADAPYHFDDAGARMDEVPVERYIGPARVVALEGRELITLADVQRLDLAGVERLLVRTGSYPDYTRFNPNFTAFAAEAIAYLAEMGVRLIGTDAHSMDPMTSHDLPAHKACGRTGMLILENLDLAAVPPGDYELIALPLRLVGADGSPIRAVLRSLT
ncbi:MAG: arylformamidase [Symbiobacteriaceae bacterium]|jgi:arylformamidase|nr:arylformamidase [Symbiobacteriaceae bacterium]